MATMRSGDKIGDTMGKPTAAKEEVGLDAETALAAAVAVTTDRRTAEGVAEASYEGQQNRQQWPWYLYRTRTTMCSLLLAQFHFLFCMVYINICYFYF
jgi:hypothetical protein